MLGLFKSSGTWPDDGKGTVQISKLLELMRGDKKLHFHSNTLEKACDNFHLCPRGNL